MNEQKQADSKPFSIQPLSEAKQPYSTPRLVCYGDIRGMTLGGSPGNGDSGGLVALHNHPSIEAQTERRFTLGPAVCTLDTGPAARREHLDMKRWRALYGPSDSLPTQPIPSSALIQDGRAIASLPGAWRERDGLVLILNGYLDQPRELLCATWLLCRYCSNTDRRCISPSRLEALGCKRSDPSERSHCPGVG